MALDNAGKLVPSRTRSEALDTLREYYSGGPMRDRLHLYLQNTATRVVKAPYITRYHGIRAVVRRVLPPYESMTIYWNFTQRRWKKADDRG